MKYLFSDVDGTLLQNDVIDPKVILKIKEFVEKGNKIYLITGRVEEDVKLIEKHMNIFGEYRISQNGAVIIRKDDILEYKETIPKAYLKQIISFLLTLEDVSIEVTTERKRYSIAPRKKVYFHEFTSDLEIKEDIFEKIEDYDITLFLVLSERFDTQKKIEEFANQYFPNELQVLLTSPGCIEILTHNGSKGLAIEYLAKKYKMQHDNIYVVGDNFNDISMFQKFSNSFSIVGCNEEVAKYASNKVKDVGEVIDFIKLNS